MKRLAKQLAEKLALQCSPEYANEEFFRSLAKVINKNIPWTHIGFDLLPFRDGTGGYWIEIECEHDDVEQRLVYEKKDHASPRAAAQHDFHVLNNLEDFLLQELT